jgi:hypothetical protein
MPVTVCLPLFAHPGKELNEGSAVTGKQLRDLAKELEDRLQKAARIVDRLLAAGWSTQMATSDILLVPPEVTSREETLQRLQALGINLEELLILEDLEEQQD